MLLNTNCNLCHSTSIKPLYSKADLNIVKCGSCGLTFLSPFPDEEAIKKLYSEDYYLAWGIQEPKNLELVRSIKMATFRRELEHLRKYVGSGKILDIGCAMGFFLEAARESNWDVYGVELSTYAAKIAQQTLGQKIYNGALEAAKFEDGFFEVVVMSDLLEHVTDPASFLTEVMRIIKPGGLLMIVTPNLESLSAKIMRRHWNHFNQEHLYYFSPGTISRFLKEKSFEVLDVYPAVKAFNYIYISSQLKIHRVPIVTPIIKLLDKILLNNSIGQALFYAYAGEMSVLARKTEIKQDVS